MTVPISDRLSQLYVGNGTNVRFDFNFRVFQQEDETGIAVRQKGLIDFETLDPSMYTVTVNQDGMGGYITFGVAPNVGVYFYVAGLTTLDQLLDITNYDNFYPDAIERALDKLTALLQERSTEIDLEKQARILADIHYDSLALGRESDLENRLISYVNAMIGITNPAIFDGISDRMIITEDGTTQREFNSSVPFWTGDYSSFKQETYLREEQILDHMQEQDQILQDNIDSEKSRAITSENILQSQINGIGSGGKAYKTYAAMNADKTNIAVNSKVTVTNDNTSSNNGDWQWDGTVFTKSIYDPLTQAKNNTTDQMFAKFSASSSFMIDEYTRTGTAATGTGDLFAIQLKQRDVVINDITLKIADFGGLTTFNCALYIVDSSMKVVTVLNSYNLAVGTSDIYKISGLNISVPNGLFLAVGLPSGIKLAHKTSGVTQTNGFYYAQSIATVLNLAVGYTPPSLQNLNTYVPGIGIKATGTTLYDDYAKIHNKSLINSAILYDYSSSAISNANANGEFWTIRRDFPNAVSISSITVNLKSLIDTTKTSFKVRPIFKHKTTNILISAGEVIEFTIQAGVTKYTALLDLTFPPDTYFSLGVESGVNIGYNSNASAGSFGYSSNTTLGISGKVGNNLPDLQILSGAVAIALTVNTQEYFDPANFVKVSDIPAKPQANYLYGKKIVAIGDSMVQGHSLSDSANQTWLAKLANRNGMTRVNYGINGTYLSNKLYGTADGAVVRYTAMDNDADYILVFAGTNDARNSTVVMGADDSTDTTTFKGALNVLCNGLITKYPNKKIGFITPYLRDTNYPAYVDAIETICAKYGIPVFNNIKRGGVCWTNTAQLSSITLNDTYHLNELGMDYVSYKYEEFIRSL